MKTKKTKQIFFNEKAFQNDLTQHENYIATLNEFAAKLKALDLQMTPELLDRFMQEDYPALSAAITEKFLSDADRNTTYLVDHVRYRANNETVPLQRYHRQITDHNLKTGLPPNLIPIINGRAYLPDELMHQIKDRHCIKIDPENELFNKLETVVNILNDFQHYCHQNELDDFIDGLPESLTIQHYIMGELIPSNFPIIPDSEYSKLIINPYFFENDN